MTGSGSDTERRKDKRYLVTGLEVFNKDSGEKLGRVVNISLGGMLITHSPTLKQNDDLSIRIHLGHSKSGLADFEADVQIRWFWQEDQTGLFGYGLAFFDNKEEQRRLIQGIIDEFSHTE